MSSKMIYDFFDTNCDVVPAEEVGGKAHHLMELKKSGLRVPEGFVLPTHLTFEMPEGGYTSDSDVMIMAKAMVRFAAQGADRKWGSSSNQPYLVSVRSGARVSMPGMMDTILNVGLNDINVLKLADMLGGTAKDLRFAYDCYRRLIQMFATTVHGVKADHFTEILGAAEEYFVDLDSHALGVAVENFKKVYYMEVGEEFPQDVDEQLRQAVNAVFSSWHSERAVVYRDHQSIPHDWGTAVTVQGMKFGNLNNASATGVVFSRDPNTGADQPYGQFLVNAQGEDVVAGTHDAQDISKLLKGKVDGMSVAGQELAGAVTSLHKQFGGIVDIEFTIENGNLWILQARKGKHTTEAAVRMTVLDLWNGNLPGGPDSAIEQIMEVLRTNGGVTAAPEDPQQEWKLSGQGEGASTGIIWGVAAFTAEQVDECKAEGKPYIFIANVTSPDDTPQMVDAVGLLTATGSTVSHAAVVARAWNVPAVVGCSDLTCAGEGALISGSPLKYGDMVKIDGSTGEVYVGQSA